MKKNNIYGAAAIISLFATIALRYLWIIENNGESAALAILISNFSNDRYSYL